MPKFKYTAIDANGKQKTGTVEAESQDDANAKLSAAGLMPTKVTAAGGGSAATTKSTKEAKKGMYCCIIPITMSHNFFDRQNSQKLRR